MLEGYRCKVEEIGKFFRQGTSFLIFRFQWGTPSNAVIFNGNSGFFFVFQDFDFRHRAGQFVPCLFFGIESDWDLVTKCYSSSRFKFCSLSQLFIINLKPLYFIYDLQ